MLSKFKPNQTIRISTIPHKKGGNALLMKSAKMEEMVWACVCPVKQKEKVDLSDVVGKKGMK
jgi:hypothetical protein